MSEKKENDNIVFVGKKGMRAYSDAVKVQFEEEGQTEVILKARSKNIVQAFNTAEFLKRKGDIEIKEIISGSEEFKDAEKKDKVIYVSSVEIHLVKK